jgi:hypothetical protein
MWEITVLLVFAALVLLWFDSMRARERALSAGSGACQRAGLQFLDETVECVSLRPARNDAGRLILRRIYRFEFSDDGSRRRAGSIVMLGADVETLTMEPFLLH